MEIVFKRQALYEEVWSTPLTKLGEKYGMSDNGIRKVCKAMNIPLPPAGHWARVEAGQEVSKLELPAHSERTTFISRLPAPPKLEFKREEDSLWLKERLAFEERPENRIVFEEHPTRWHRDLIPIREAYKEAVKDRQAALKERAAYRKNQFRSATPRPNLSGLLWADLDSGLLRKTHRANYLSVSILTYERALAVVNALFIAAQKRGCKVGIDDENGRFQISLESASVYFAIRERQDTELIPKSESGMFSRQTQKVPTDRLALVMGQYTFEAYSLVDKESARIETRLDEVFFRLYRFVVAAREQAREDEVKRKQQAIQRVAWEALTKQREQEAKVKADESRRREELLGEADRWQQAEQIRAYVAAVVARDEAGTAEVTAWAEWALLVADEKDPVVGRLAKDES